MNAATLRNTATRYIASTAGLLLVALGIALSIISNLGTSPLSCPAYILSLRWKPTVGEFTIIVNTSLILVQLLALRSKFKLKYLMQIPASLVFGYMIDFWMWALSGLSPLTLLSRFSLIFVGCVITAFGVSLEILAQAWMLSAEMTVYAFTRVTPYKFGNLKVVMDCLFVLLAAALSWFLFRNPFGSGELVSFSDVLLARTSGLVIGAGTLVCAVLPGLFVRWTDPLVEKINSWLLKMNTTRKWQRTKRGEKVA